MSKSVNADLAGRLKELSEKATPGPWEIGDTEPLMIYMGDKTGSRIADLSHPGYGARGSANSNTALIVELVNNLPAILSALQSPSPEGVNREMLEALKGLYALMDDGDGLSAADPEESAIAYAKRVIAKAESLSSQVPEGFDLIAYLGRQWPWSEETFGPGDRTAGVLDHIRKELKEIEAAPDDLSEWVDVVILAMDGVWRRGFTAEQFCAALQAKQDKNFARQWPDWRTQPKDKAIEHVRPASPSHSEGER